jgi:hypothetical protein
MPDREIQMAKDWTQEKLIDTLEKECEQLRNWYIAKIDQEAELQTQIESCSAEIERLREALNGAYSERNNLVALLASMFPSGTKKTAIEGWDEEWHGCVYIDFPWGQTSWHYHSSEADLFSHLPEYHGDWDGHTTEQKYAAIRAALKGDE